LPFPLPSSFALTAARTFAAVNGSRRINTSGGNEASTSGVERPVLAK
jgi:hypothetical protein